MFGKVKQNPHLFLIWNSDGVTGNQSSDLLCSKAIELITLKNLKQLNESTSTNQSTHLDYFVPL